MNSIEKEKIFEWAKENHSESNDILMKKNLEMKSYFETFSQDENFVEYGFSNLPNFKNQLLKMWQDDSAMEKISLPCSVAAFKLKPIEDNISPEEVSDKEFVIPEFVYAF